MTIYFKKAVPSCPELNLKVSFVVVSVIITAFFNLYKDNKYSICLQIYFTDTPGLEERI